MADNSVSQGQASLLDGKVCKQCRVWKPIKRFKAQKQCAGGREPRCRACSESPEVKKRADLAYYRKHRKEIIARVSAYTRERADEKNAYLKDYYRANKPKLREQGKAYIEKQKAEQGEAYYEEQRIRSREYRRDNKPKLCETAHNARARRMQAEGRWTKEEWAALCEHYGQICLGCGEQKKLHRDHVIPLIKGGRNDIQNLQCLCHSCNSRKNVKDIDYRPDKGEWAWKLKRE